MSTPARFQPLSAVGLCELEQSLAGPLALFRVAPGGQQRLDQLRCAGTDLVCTRPEALGRPLADALVMGRHVFLQGGLPDMGAGRVQHPVMHRDPHTVQEHLDQVGRES